MNGEMDQMDQTLLITFVPLIVGRTWVSRLRYAFLALAHCLLLSNGLAPNST